MLITADWVLPVSRPPIRDGAVIIEGANIVEVGRKRHLEGLSAGERVDFPGCVLMPGLVNAHTHLSLSAMEGLLGPDAFIRWLPRLVAAMRSWDREDFSASARLGARRCLESGVTVVGDIAYGPESAQIADDAGLGGVFYWEVLGINAEELPAALERMAFPGPAEPCGRIAFGLSPHSAYTSGPGLLQAIHELASERSLPVAVHVAESAEETELMSSGAGELGPVSARLAAGFEPPGCGTTAYLDRLGVLERATAVHLGEIVPAEVPRLAAAARGAVTCPRSNRYLSNRLTPVRRLLAAGIAVGVGTDSSASNKDLDLFEELRLLQAADPEISSRSLIEMATAMGAVALGVEDRFGTLEPGMQADLAVFRVGTTVIPEDDLVRFAGKRALEAVMSAGTWRVRDKKATGQSTASLVRAAANGAERARLAIDALPS